MKLLKTLLTSILFIGCLVCNGQDIEDTWGIVVYTDSIQPADMRDLRLRSFSMNHVPSSTVESGTMASRQGKFQVTYDDNYFMTDGVKHCLKIALDTWEEKINIIEPIRFHVCVSENLESGVAIQSHVGYHSYQRTAWPDNLRNQTSPTAIALHDTININAFVDWNSSWPYDGFYNGKVNLTNGFLCNIARILGFGCSIVNRNGRPNFSLNMTPSLFDRLLYSGDTCLANLIRPNSDLLPFFSQDTELRFDSYVYDMYDAGSFVLNKSGLFFSLGYDNIMEYSLNNQLDILPVNKETLNVLNQIGWDVVDTDNEIICDSTDALGYGSIYRHYNFTLKNNPSAGAGNARWCYQVFNNVNNDYHTVQSGFGSQFSVQPSAIESSMDEFMCHQARVICEIGGKQYFYPLSFETRPLIENVSITNYTQTDHRRYQVNISVEQRGYTHGTIIVSDDTGTVREYNYTGGQITVTNLYNRYPIYVSVNLQNEFGAASASIIAEPYLSQHSKMSAHLTMIESTENDESVFDGLRDSDELTFSLSETISPADSLCWYVDIGGISKRIYPVRKDSQTYTYAISRDSLDIYIVKKCSQSMIRYEGGKTWKSRIWDTDAPCIFKCYVYKDSYKNSSPVVYATHGYSLDVLPSCPAVNIHDHWLDDYYGNTVTYLKYSVNVANASAYLIYVDQYDYFMDYLDGIVTENLGNEYDMWIAYPDDKIYCIALNDYGSYQGPEVGIGSTGISSTFTYNIIINGKSISVPDASGCPVLIYSATGKLVATIKDSLHTRIQLPSGVYIIRTSNSKTNNSKKVIIN